MTPEAPLPGPLVHPPLVAMAAALLIATFATDLLYWQTQLFQWNNFSIWLLTAGLTLAAAAGLALLLDVARRRLPSIAWDRFGGFTAAAVLGVLNAFIHSRDAYTAVVPDGLQLSTAITVILISLGWRGWSLRRSASSTLESHS